ncbi:LysM domain-containing protein [Clostridium sp.]|uniref:LysM peptidoglycan-binding domain-containing protein n=1 Tax=Clostridium sp. TaxID=1506 RepID=UPI001A5AFCB6|nr:LysM domain-containing protein [Clostridium sp.]MBK5240601.1 LysM peptidoglycan-binding domain-containing protein [Clostridium sp.]
MRMKKGLITISTIAIVILGVFFAVRFIGSGDDTAKEKTPDKSVVQTDNSIIESNTQTLANENDESNISLNEMQNEVEDIQVANSNELDEVYINDKTNVGIYTVKKNDTVFGIVSAHMPSHDINEILNFVKDRNNMDESYKIAEGDEIIIPYEKAIETATVPVSDAKTTEYTVKNQDTLTSIAKNIMPTYGVKEAIEVLKETNGITDENDIKEGSVINIPK